MFNMGGPIKEGVMHGIREPYRHGRRVGYKDGGWGDYFKNIFTKSKPLVKQVVGKKLKPVVGAIDKIAEQKWLQSLHPSRIKQTISTESENDTCANSSNPISPSPSLSAYFLLKY